MKHIIMGTAGHIDHGKTTLIKALTGIDCDTHKQEKARGITINLGFAHFNLPDGESIGVVDVPGHRSFVRTMVNGASGIDLALLTVAADDGIMPQTREHLQILEVLQIRAGLVAITKVDLEEPDLVDLAVEEVNELIDGTFLAGCPIVKVSSVTGVGLDALKDAIQKVALGLQNRPVGEIFRLFIDRIFTVAGFGTVVTGSVISGRLSVGDKAYLLPGNKELRVRRLERYGEEIDSVCAGDRASLNLVGLDREDFQNGMIVADRLLRSTTMIDVRLRLFEHARSLDLWSRVLFHLGTYEHQARMHLIDHEKLMAGQIGLAQIHLDTPCVTQYGDHFVIRSTSNDITIGGGEIIDPAPLHHRRRTEKLIAAMTQIAEGDAAELAAAEVRKRFKASDHREIAHTLNLTADQVRNVSEKLPRDIVRYIAADDIYFIVRKEHDRLSAVLLKHIADFHRRHRLEENGPSVQELMGALGMTREPASKAVLEQILGHLENEKKVRRIDNTWALPHHFVESAWDNNPKVAFVGEFLSNCDMSMPLISDLRSNARKNGVEKEELEEILKYLVRKGRAYFFEGDYLHGSIVDKCRRVLGQALARRPEGMTIAQFRDLVRGNRRICLALIGIYDLEGFTRRKGDLRFLTEKGKKMIQGIYQSNNSNLNAVDGSAAPNQVHQSGNTL